MAMLILHSKIKITRYIETFCPLALGQTIGLDKILVIQLKASLFHCFVTNELLDGITFI